MLDAIANSAGGTSRMMPAASPVMAPAPPAGVLGVSGRDDGQGARGLTGHAADL